MYPELLFQERVNPCLSCLTSSVTNIPALHSTQSAPPGGAPHDASLRATDARLRVLPAVHTMVLVPDARGDPGEELQEAVVELAASW